MDPVGIAVSFLFTPKIDMMDGDDHATWLAKRFDFAKNIFCTN